MMNPYAWFTLFGAAATVFCTVMCALIITDSARGGRLLTAQNIGNVAQVLFSVAITLMWFSRSSW